MAENRNREEILESGWIPYPPERLHELLEQTSPEVEECLLTMGERIQKLSEIGIALSAEKTLPHLLERIVEEACYMTNADGGTLYLVSDDGTSLNFEIARTQSLDIRMGGESGDPITWQPLPLYIDGKPNEANVSAYVALTGELVNISDVYNIAGFDFFRNQTV